MPDPAPQRPLLLVPNSYVLDAEGTRVPDIPSTVVSWGQVNDDLDTGALPFATKRPIIVAEKYDESDLMDWASMTGNRLRRLDGRSGQWGLDLRDKTKGPAFRAAAMRKMLKNSEEIANQETWRRKRADITTGWLLPLLGTIGMYGVCKLLGLPEELVLAAPTNLVGITGTISHWEDIAHSSRQPPDTAVGYQPMDGLAPIEGDGTWNSPSGEAKFLCWKNDQSGQEGNGRLYENDNGNTLMHDALEGTSINVLRHFAACRAWQSQGIRNGAVVAYNSATRVDYDTADCYFGYHNSTTTILVHRRTAAGVNTSLSSKAISAIGTDYPEVELAFDDSFLSFYSEGVLTWFGRDTAHSAGGEPGMVQSSNAGMTEWGAGDLTAVAEGGGGGSSVATRTVNIGSRQGFRIS